MAAATAVMMVMTALPGVTMMTEGGIMRMSVMAGGHTLTQSVAQGMAAAGVLTGGSLSRKSEEAGTRAGMTAGVATRTLRVSASPAQAQTAGAAHHHPQALPHPHPQGQAPPPAHPDHQAAPAQAAAGRHALVSMLVTRRSHAVPGALGEPAGTLQSNTCCIV
jgi:hypothetical protein